MECPYCGGTEATATGTLGSRYWLRCRACGSDFSVLHVQNRIFTPRPHDPVHDFRLPDVEPEDEYADVPMVVAYS